MFSGIYLIVNPTSGSYSPARIDQAMGILARHGIEPQLLETAGPVDASLFAARICREQTSPLIIVAGGDGTVNGVLNGLEPGKAALAVLPVGTANVLARELGIASLEDAAVRIARGETKAATAGCVEGKGWRRLFILMAGVGFDGAVVAGVRLPEKRRFGKVAYLLSAVRCLRQGERDRLRVVAGGRTIGCHTVIVCNAAHYGGGVRIAPGADLFRPDLRAVCITQGGAGPLVRLAARLLAGRKPDMRGVETVTAQEFTIDGTRPVQLDGDPFGSAPVTIRALPGFVRVVV